MSFAKVPGLKGKVYIPHEHQGFSKKHACQDCFACQQCSDDRCRVCRDRRHCRCHKEHSHK